ncbi:solute carrier family 2, facilitated glucose transporter member 11 isoform X2 [Lemur catta]|uniref:solute carrier family 2, facilitated glucose transporter member 11 isoform X2 n=1 Tax=Lemur catta TaxID=9447 RepID=UPI001E26B55D|nr:solute carrier family 2, facilitated glucose transporter member 11 isoform X2 [Lemur catta]
MRALQRLVQGRVLLLTICAAGIGGTFQFGYNLSIINAPTLHIQEFTNETWRARTGRLLPDHQVLLVWSLIVALYPLGGLFGALLAGPLAITLGRKKSLLVNNAFVVAAAILFGFSRKAGSFEMLMLGRLLMGVSAGGRLRVLTTWQLASSRVSDLTGKDRDRDSESKEGVLIPELIRHQFCHILFMKSVSMSVQPMYLGESAPKELRGAVAMTSAVFTALGIVTGQVVGLRELLGGPQAWPLLLASCLVPGAVQLASLPLLPESPRYLLIDRGDTEACRAGLAAQLAHLSWAGAWRWGAARAWPVSAGLFQSSATLCLSSLQRLRGTRDVAEELEELEREGAACQGCRTQRPWELFQHRALRRQVTSLVVLGSAMELCGNDTVYAYASSVFWEAGVPGEKVQYAIIGTGGCELLSAIVSCVVIEKLGRRLLLVGGYGLMAGWASVFTAALCLQSSLPGMPYLAVACVFAFILSFGIGPAGVTGILATELFDQTARPAAYVICGVLMWTMLFLVGLGFPFIMEGLSHFLYVPFLGVCVCGAIYAGLFLPETKGKSFLEISEELHRLNFPWRAQGPAWRGPEVTESTEL